MIINGQALLDKAPIKNMLTTKERVNDISHGLAEVGYDIRLKQDVRFYPPRYQMTSSRGPVRAPAHSIDDRDLRYIGNFCLASTIEEFQMPDDLTGIVHDKSTWARHGLSVFNTVIEPGWKGFLTLELVYHGQEPLHIPAGSGIAQAIFHQVQIPANYQGRYQNQADRPIRPCNT